MSNNRLKNAANEIMRRYEYSSDRIARGVDNPGDHQVVAAATKLSDSNWVDAQIRKIHNVQIPSGYNPYK